MLYYIAFLPTKEITQRVLDIQKKYQKGNVPVPHITVTAPFSYKNGEEELIAEIDKVISKFSPFETKLQGLDTFNKGAESVLYAKVTSMGVMAEIHRKLGTILTQKGARSGKDFKQDFHMTLLKNMTPEDIQSVEKEIKNIKFNDTFRLEELILFGIEQQAPWKIIKRFCFKDE